MSVNAADVLLKVVADQVLLVSADLVVICLIRVVWKACGGVSTELVES